MTYVSILILYINKIYILGDNDDKPMLLMLLGLAIVYPTCFELFQQYKLGFRKYFSDIGNFSDILYTCGGILNLYV